MTVQQAMPQEALVVSLNDAYERAIGRQVPSLSRIEQMPARDLEPLLHLIDRVIENPGIVDLGTTAKGSTSTNDAERFRENAVASILLQRKHQVLARLALLKPAEHLDSVKAAVDQRVDDPYTRLALHNSIDAAAQSALEDVTNFRRQEEQTDVQRHSVLLYQLEVKERLLGLQERRSKIYKSFLERESMASIVGGTLLLALGIAAMTAMFAGIQTTEVVTSAFLLILGYFFGQATSGSAKGE